MPGEMSSSGYNMPFDMGADMSQLFGGLFGHSDRPYKEAGKQYEQFGNRAQQVQNPFLNMGTSAIPQFQDWLKGMSNPSEFINTLMGGYNESPWAKFQQQQALRAAGNQGSASGLIGSTPMAQFEQQNAQNISSQDMQNWLSNVLGINTQYGAGLGNEITGGQNAANTMSNIFQEMARNMAEAKFGQVAGKNQDRRNLWGGLFNVGKDIGSMFL